MTEIEKIFLTSGLTVLSAVIIFALSQIIGRLVVQPYIEYKKVIGKIDEELIFYSNIYANAGSLGNNNPIYKKASIDFRRLASKFSASYNSIVWKSYFIINKWLIDKRLKNIVVSNLVFISNALWNSEFIDKNLTFSKEIRNILKVDF